MQLPDRPKDFYAVRSAVDRDDVTLIELLVAHGVERDDDAIYHACEHGSTAMREALWKPGAEQDVGHKVDFEDLDRVRWFIARGADMNERCCLHHGVRAPARRPPALGNPDTDGYGWILGQFALLDRVEIVRTLLDAGMDVDTRGWSNFTPLDQAAMHGRRATVELLIERGADLTDRAWGRPRPDTARLRDLGAPLQPGPRRGLRRHGRGARGGRRADLPRASERGSGRRPCARAARRVVSRR